MGKGKGCRPCKRVLRCLAGDLFGPCGRAGPHMACYHVRDRSCFVGVNLRF